uniref:Uncharacterized protein n=1 Tax=uncultured bacterium A1Q1_fos_1093 TaxID=1256542 RepID=L7VXE0_9BACT|nr:hypothetical protein [uncultured bacterium A1Q1_fos_1093]
MLYWRQQVICGIHYQKFMIFTVHKRFTRHSFRKKAAHPISLADL